MESLEVDAGGLGANPRVILGRWDCYGPFCGPFYVEKFWA